MYTKTLISDKTNCILFKLFAKASYLVIRRFLDILIGQVLIVYIYLHKVLPKGEKDYTLFRGPLHAYH